MYTNLNGGNNEHGLKTLRVNKAYVYNDIQPAVIGTECFKLDGTITCHNANLIFIV